MPFSWWLNGATLWTCKIVNFSPVASIVRILSFKTINFQSRQKQILLHIVGLFLLCSLIIVLPGFSASKTRRWLPGGDRPHFSHAGKSVLIRALSDRNNMNGGSVWVFTWLGIVHPYRSDANITSDLGIEYVMFVVFKL